MLYYGITDVCGGINVNKTNDLQQCIGFHSNYFCLKNFKFQPCTGTGCHNVLQRTIEFNNIVIVFVM